MLYHLLQKVSSKYQIITADFKTVEKKFLDQGEDKAEVKEYLEIFKKLRDKNILQGQDRDIDLVGKKPWAEFKSFVDLASEQKSKTEMKHIARNEGAKLVFEDDNWQVYHILSYEASKLYGSGTKWCISSNETDENWNSYNKESHFYALISKNKTKENPFYKIAVQVYTTGKIVAWDALDKSHTLQDLSLRDDLDELPDFKYEKPLEGFVVNGVRHNLVDIEKEIKNNPEKLKNILIENGYKEFVPNGVVVETWDNLDDYARSESKDLRELLKRLENGDLIDDDSVDQYQLNDLLDEVSKKKEFEAEVVNKITPDDLKAYAELGDYDLEDVQKEFSEDPVATIKDMFNYDIDSTDRIKEALERGVNYGYRSGTEVNAWDEIKYWFENVSEDYYFELSESDWVYGPIKLVLPFLYVIPEISDVIDGHELTSQFEKPEFKWPNIATEYNEDAAVEEFFQVLEFF